jgi:hypothetical protein
MSEFFHFASENPALTFFLALIIGITIIESINYIACAIGKGGRSPKKRKDDNE